MGLLEYIRGPQLTDDQKRVKNQAEKIKELQKKFVNVNESGVVFGSKIEDYREQLKEPLEGYVKKNKKGPVISLYKELTHKSLGIILYETLLIYAKLLIEIAVKIRNNDMKTYNDGYEAEYDYKTKENLLIYYKSKFIDVIQNKTEGFYYVDNFDVIPKHILTVLQEHVIKESGTTNATNVFLTDNGKFVYLNEILKEYCGIIINHIDNDAKLPSDDFRTEYKKNIEAEEETKKKAENAKIAEKKAKTDEDNKRIVDKYNEDHTFTKLTTDIAKNKSGRFGKTINVVPEGCIDENGKIKSVDCISGVKSLTIKRFKEESGTDHGIDSTKTTFTYNIGNQSVDGEITGQYYIVEKKKKNILGFLGGKRKTRKANKRKRRSRKRSKRNRRK